MKLNRILFGLFFSFCVANAQTTAIPDTNFEQELVNQGIDTNGLNGNILDVDAQAVTNLMLAGTAITDITGINAFVNITDLDLGSNLVINIAPTALTVLTNFKTDDNTALVSVDFSQNVLLETVFIHGDFPGPPPITTIDLSQNLNLISFKGDFLDNVSDIIFPVTNSLIDINVRYLSDTTFDLSLLSGLEDLTIGGWRGTTVITLPNVFTSLKNLRISSIDIPTIDISNYTNLESIYFWGTYVENLLLPNSTALTDIFIILHDIQNPLDLSVFPNLTDLYISSNRDTPLVVDITQNLVLEDITLTSNDMNSIDLTQNVLLKELRLDTNNLTALDVTQNILLNRLSARSNQLPGIDLTQNVILRYLTLSFNLIPSLDVTQNIDIRSIAIDNNLFTGTGLDLTQNIELSYLNAGYNQIESLDITQNVNLYTLNIEHNIFPGNDILNQFYAIQNNRGRLNGSLVANNNLLTGIVPDFYGLYNPTIQTRRFELFINENSFHFGDFEDQHLGLVGLRTTMSIDPSPDFVVKNYLYAPQAKVNTTETLNVNAGDPITLTTTVRGTQNHYTWFKDGVAIPGAPDSPNYTIPSVSSCDQAVYHSEITSDLVPFENADPPGTSGKNLLLIRNDITLNVTSPTESCTSLISPTNGSTNIAINEMLTWTESLGACGYYISIGTTSGGIDILNNVDIGDVESYAIGSDFPVNTEVFVTITPYFFNGTVLNCTEESFTTGTNINTPTIPGDMLCDATAITINAPAISGDNTNATSEPNEPLASCWWTTNPVNSIWYSFVAPPSGSVAASTDFPNTTLHDSHLAIYDVGNCSDMTTLTELACDEDGGTEAPSGYTSVVEVTGLVPGNTYFVHLDGYLAYTGDYFIEVYEICTTTADILGNQTECDSYTLPALTVGNYFTASGGTGTAMYAGDNITTSQTLYIYEANGTCSDESSFDIIINNTPTVDILTNQTECDSYTLPALTVGNYFTASGGTGTAMYAGDNITTSQTLYIYEANGTCSDESSFDIIINNTPTVDIFTNQTECDSYTLPTLTVGNYFTASGGTGTAMYAGDNITTSQTLYIYKANGTCSDESSFDIIINNTPTVDVFTNQTECDSYTLPALTVGNYFTASGGTGTAMYAGDNITTSQTLYIYEANGTCSDESSFDIIINNTPTVDVFTNQTECDSYTLPALTVGNYFTASGGTGTAMSVGDNITASQTLYIYEANGTCSDESSFDIIINNTPTVDIFTNQTECDSYTLPTLTVGNYFTASGGTGTAMSVGDNITASQTLYIYEANGTCSDESSFDIIINNTPTVDVLTTQTACDRFILPTLTVGNYFTASGGTGTAMYAGDNITTSQTLYIYEANGTCTDESSFDIIINNTPTVDILTNQTECDSYTLPTLFVGNYFTASGGTGTAMYAGNNITTSQTLYIYEANGTCTDESSFDIIINNTPTVDILTNQTECDSYTLPTLTVGNYFTASGGTGTAMYAGDNITASQTLYIYEANGTCTDESSFDIIINNTPTVDIFTNQTECDSYTLPTLFVGNYFTASGGTGTAMYAGDTITTSQMLYVYEVNGTCSDESSFDVIINNTPTVDVLTNQTECDSYTLPTLTVGNYFTASGGTGTAMYAGDNITASQTLYIYEANGTCSDESSFDVIIQPGTDFDLTLSNITIEEQSITIHMTDLSINYLFSVHGSNYQANNQFFNLPNGMHTLYATDVNGCIEKSISFEINTVKFHIPKYFTPNGDGYNDTWKIVDPKKEIKFIYIFDRYGKLLKTMGPNSQGWDGYFANTPLRTSDYWYYIELQDGKQVKGHFTLKR